MLIRPRKIIICILSVIFLAFAFMFFSFVSILSLSEQIVFCLLIFSLLWVLKRMLFNVYIKIVDNNLCINDEVIPIDNIKRISISASEIYTDKVNLDRRFRDGVPKLIILLRNEETRFYSIKLFNKIDIKKLIDEIESRYKNSGI